MKTIDFKWNGDKELLEKLRRIEAKVEKQISKKAVRAGGSEYAKLVRKQIPKDPTPDDVHLKKSIAIATPKGRSKNDIRVQVGIKGQARYYAHVFEFGSKFVKGTRIFTRTLESSAQQIFDRMATRLKFELDKV